MKLGENVKRTGIDQRENRENISNKIVITKAIYYTIENMSSFS